MASSGAAAPGVAAPVVDARGAAPTAGAPPAHAHAHTRAPPHAPVVAHNRAFLEAPPPPVALSTRTARAVRQWRAGISWRDLGVLRWAPKYTRSAALADFVAAAVVAIVMVPQAMAYALLAGLDPVYGLYASTVPLFVYGLFTWSAQVSPGPVAPTAILLESMARSISGAAPRTPAFTAAHMAMTFMAGVLQLVLAGLRLGWVADLISWPVMSGFASAAAFNIMASQLADFFGLTVPREAPWVSSFAQRLYRAIGAAGSINWATTGIAAASLLVLLKWRALAFRGYRLHPRTPVPLILVLIGVLISWAADLRGTAGVRVVGTIPSGMPTPSIPLHSLEEAVRALPGAAIVMLVSYVQTVSLAVLFGKKKGEPTNGTAEMLALGSAWLVGSFFQCYTIAGSFTRTTVQSEAGPRTPGVIFFLGGIMVVFIFTLTRVLPYLPMATLAAIVVASTQSLVSVSDARTLWRSKPSDFAQLAVTFAAVLALDVTYGLVAGIAFSLLLVLYRSFQPRLTELGRLPGSDVFVALDRFEECRRVPGVLVLRLDGELHFGNVRMVTERLLSLLAGAQAAAAARAARLAAGAPAPVAIPVPQPHPSSQQPQQLDRTFTSDLALGLGLGGGGGGGGGGAHAQSPPTPPQSLRALDGTMPLVGSSAAAAAQAPSRKTRVVYALSIASKDPSEGVRSRRRGGAGEETLTLLDGGGGGVEGGGALSPPPPPVDAAVLSAESAVVATAERLAQESLRDGVHTTASSAPSLTAAAGSAASPSRSALDALALLDADEPLHAVILDGSRVVDIDSTACREMQSVIEAYGRTEAARRVQLLFAALPGPVRDTLDLFGMDKATDPSATRFLSITSAIASLHERLEEAGDWEEATRNTAAYADAPQQQQPQQWAPAAPAAATTAAAGDAVAAAGGGGGGA